jgi:hypothetical protein
MTAGYKGIRSGNRPDPERSLKEVIPIGMGGELAGDKSGMPCSTVKLCMCQVSEETVVTYQKPYVTDIVNKLLCTRHTGRNLLL